MGPETETIPDTIEMRVLLSISDADSGKRVLALRAFLEAYLVFPGEKIILIDFPMYSGVLTGRKADRK